MNRTTFYNTLYSKKPRRTQLDCFSPFQLHPNWIINFSQSTSYHITIRYKQIKENQTP